MVQFCYCGRQEEPAILISRLLLRMRRMYEGSIPLDVHLEWMESTKRNLITRVSTFYPSLSEHASFDHLWNLRKAQHWSKSLWAFDRYRPHSLAVVIISLRLYYGTEICSNRWQEWMWIETWKNWVNFFKFPCNACKIHLKNSLRGRPSKGKGKGIRARDHARALAPKFPPSFSPFNACHAG